MGDIEPQCQAGLLLGAKGELGIPSAIKGFYTDFGLQLSAKGYKFQYGNMVNTDERHFTENLNYLVVPVHIGYKILCVWECGYHTQQINYSEYFFHYR